MQKNKNKEFDVLINPNHHTELNRKLKDFEKKQGKDYLNYRDDWANFPKKDIIKKFPMHLDIEATSACNMKCTMCPRTELLNEGRFWRIQNFNFETYKKIINEGTDSGQLKSIKLQYLGEPLINKKLVEMIKYAKSKGVLDVQFNTNASLMNEKKSEEIIKSGVDKVFFSFDSPYREKYNSIRIGGDYDQVLANIKSFMKIRKKLGFHKPLTRVQMVLNKDNLGEWEDFKKLFEPIVDTVGYGTFIDHLKGKEKKEKSKFRCPFLWQRMFVHPDGLVTPCCADAGRKLIMGNIKKNSLTEIWNNKKYENLRKTHRSGKYYKIKECSSCSIANYRGDEL